MFTCCAGEPRNIVPKIDTRESGEMKFAPLAAEAISEIFVAGCA
jgi:hypothetical protein